jgi:hypothetical protein
MGERGAGEEVQFEDRSLLRSRINDKTMKRIRGQASIFRDSFIFAVTLLLLCCCIAVRCALLSDAMDVLRSTPQQFWPGQVVNGPIYLMRAYKVTSSAYIQTTFRASWATF